MGDTVLIKKSSITAIADGFRERDGIKSNLYLDQMAVLARQGGVTLVADVPTTPGQWACLARASQMRDIKYTPKADMYAAVEDSRNFMQAGIEYTGIIYSSVRALDWGFIGYGVSLYSYLTALNNPKSIIYTKKYSDYFSGGGELVYNVYGTNCSEYVSYCLDFPYLWTTNVIPTLANVEEICYDETTQTVDTEALRRELRLCDMLGGIDDHIEIVTGIRRDKNGLIQEVESSDSWTPRIRKTVYTWEDFIQHFIVEETYRFHRYADLDKVEFPENLTDIVYSDICTSRGDKVSIRPDMDITLNVLGNGYEGIALFKDGTLVDTQASTDDWELTGLATGKYTAILYKSGETVTIDDANENNSTSFIVCNVSVSRSGTAYTYTAEAINGVYPKPMQITLKNALGNTFEVKKIENDFDGTGTVEFSHTGYVPSIVNCPFKTEYGFVIAECSY